MKIRKIEPCDNKAVEDIIRSCLIEYGADHAGTAWEDESLGKFYEVYSAPSTEYWVAEDEMGTLVGGVGIGYIDGEDDVCELQKMYCVKSVRGTGVAQQLLDVALGFASEYYGKCYLETLPNMMRAQRFYEKNGFVRTDKAIGHTGHFACDVRYIKELSI